MRARMDAVDWAATPLGPREAWPQSLKTAAEIVLGSPVAMVLMWGVEGVLIHNDAFRRFIGRRGPQVLGVRAAEAWPEFAADNAQLIRQVLGGQTVSRHEQELRLDRGQGPEPVFVDLDYSPVNDEGGTPAGVLVILIETPDPREASTRIQAANDRLDLALSAGNGIGTWDWDVPADRIFADARFARLYGVDPERAREGASLAEFFGGIHPDDHALVQSRIEEVLKTGDLFREEYRLVQADGSVRWVTAEGRPLLSPSGAPMRFPGVTYDITPRKAAEQRQAALLAFNERISEARDVAEAGLIAAQAIAERLGGARAGYGAVDLEAETVSYEREWTREDAVATARVAHLRTYGDFIDDLKAGQTVVAPDIRTHPATQGDREAYRTRGVAAFAAVPVQRRGVLAAIMSVASPEVQSWSDDEIGFLEDVAGRAAAVIERLRTEEALRRSEERYRTLFEAIDEGFCLIEMVRDAEGWPVDYRFLQVNPAFQRQTGLSDAVGRTMRELAPGHEQHWFDIYGRVAETGEPVRFEDTAEALGRYYDVYAVRVGEAGEDQVAILFNDVSERRAAEAALREMNLTLEQRITDTLAERKVLADVVESVDAFVQVIGPDYTWRAINRAAADEFEQVFGHRPEVGQNLREVLAHLPEERARFERIWDRALAGGAVNEIMEVGDPARTRNPHEIRLYPLRDGAGQVIGAFKFGYDVSDRLAEQRRLMEAEEQLRQSQKMEAVGQLTGGIAHDFNNLLAGISGSLELLSKRLAEGRTTGLERYVSGAQGAAVRAASLTQRLLAFSRRQTLDPKPTDVNRLIAGMEDLIRGSVGANIAVEVVGAAGLWPTRIDPSQLENALLNLCINARDAMAPDGGRLTIETANKWLDERAARERELQPGQYISLCVTDTGSGMSAATIEKIFDPFFTTKPLGQGTGLGLSMIHGFVRQSGGQIRVYSEVGEGTTMCLYLPRHVGALDEAEPVIDSRPDGHGHGETILIIDDEPTVRALVAEVLGEAGYSVIEAQDGPTGLRILETDVRIDLLVTDVGLPGGMNGRQVADAARVSRPGLKVLFITGYAENAAVGNGLLGPGMEVITKPFVMTELAAKVTEMVEGPPGLA